MDSWPIGTRHWRRIGIPCVAVALAASVAGCGGDDDVAADVASLGTDVSTPPDDTTTDNNATDGDIEPEEAFLAYTECMRDHGIDMPDPIVERDGGGGGFRVIQEDDGEDGPRLDPESGEFQAAEAECSSILDDAIGQIEIDPEREAEMREQMLEFAECMRDQGIDFPDPVFGNNGRVEQRMENDGTDEAVVEDAMEACAEITGGPLAAPAIGVTADD